MLKTWEKGWENLQATLWGGSRIFKRGWWLVPWGCRINGPRPQNFRILTYCVNGYTRNTSNTTCKVEITMQKLFRLLAYISVIFTFLFYFFFKVTSHLIQPLPPPKSAPEVVPNNNYCMINFITYLPRSSASSLFISFLCFKSASYSMVPKEVMNRQLFTCFFFIRDLQSCLSLLFSYQW